MPAQHFALFDTPVGYCGIAWNERGIAGVQLPERDAAATRARLRRRYPEAHETSPPAAVQQVIGDITAQLRGEARAFSSVTLDLEDVPPFHREVYAVARGIAAGATLSYG